MNRSLGFEPLGSTKQPMPQYADGKQTDCKDEGDEYNVSP